MIKNSLFYDFLRDICHDDRVADDIYYVKHMVESHNANVIPLIETTLNRVFTKHANEGYFIISASRGNNTPAENAALTKQLEKDLSELGYSYLPISGGFIENRGMPDERDVTEDSCLVMGRTPRTTPEEQDKFIQKMLSDAQMLCQKYNQDSVLVQVPGEHAKYITKDGSIDMEFDGPNKYNDLTQDYFSRLHRGKVNKPSQHGSHGQWSMTAESVECPHFSLTTHGLSECMNSNHVRHLRGDLSEAIARGVYGKPVIESNVAKQVISGAYRSNHNLDFVIMTGENPNCEQQTRAVNKERNMALEDYLRKGHYMFSKVNGKYGNIEHSYVIAGIPLAEAKTLSKRFGQQSFIYCNRQGDKPICQFWAFDPLSGNYSNVDTVDSIDYRPKIDNDDFYTYSNDYRMSMDFKQYDVDNDTNNHDGSALGEVYGIVADNVNPHPDKNETLFDPTLIQNAIDIIDAKYECMDQTKQGHFRKSLTEGMTGKGRYQERVMAGL